MAKKGKKNIDKNLEKFGKKLARLKKESKLSYRKLAAKCNLEHSDIKRYVDGEINPTLLSLIDLSKAFGVKLKVLVDIDWDDDEQKNEDN